MSPFLAQEPIGAELTFSGPHGYFTFQPSPWRPVFIAAGIGIAPFYAMVRAGAADFTLIHGARTEEQLYYRPVFAAAAARYILCLSRSAPAGGSHDNVFSGRVTGYLKHHPPPEPCAFYVCGHTAMVRDTVLLLDDLCTEPWIRTEIFG
jgi:Na+-transporting NADH:ubiquinone oxidoreductase subunit F